MLKAKKKITKKVLKQDNLVSAYAKLTSWYYHNKNIVNYGLFALIIIIAGGYIWIKYNRDRNEKAAFALSKISSVYDQGMYQSAIDGMPERGVMGLKKIVEDYGSTESGQFATLFLANAYYNLGQIDEAQKYFEEFDLSDSELKASALAGIAACYEVKENFKEAAIYFEKAANRSSNKLNIPEYLRLAVRNYVKVGNKEKAQALSERVKKEFPRTTAVREVERYLAQLQAS